MNNKPSKILSFASQRIRFYGFTAPRGISITISPFAFHFCTFEGGFRCGPHLLRNLDDALSLFHQMLRIKPQPPAPHFNNLFTILVKMNHHSHVIPLFKHLHLLGFRVNEVTRNIVINCYCRLKQVESGFAIMATFLKRGYAPDIVSLNCLIKGLFSQGKVVEAEELFSRMMEKDFLPTVVTYTTLIQGLCDFRRLDKAMKVLNLMINKGLKPDVISYSTIINSYCKHKKLDHAWRLFKKLPQKGLKLDVTVYNTMLQGLFSVGRCSDALDLYIEMKSVGLVADLYTYNTVLDGLFKNGKFEDATLFFHEVDSKGLAEFLYCLHSWFMQKQEI